MGDSGRRGAKELNRVASAIDQFIRVFFEAPPGLVGQDKLMPLEDWALEELYKAQSFANYLGNYLQDFSVSEQGGSPVSQLVDWPKETQTSIRLAASTLGRVTRRWGIPEASRGELKSPRISGCEAKVTSTDQLGRPLTGRVTIPWPQGGEPRLPGIYLTIEEMNQFQWCLVAIVTALYQAGEFTIENKMGSAGDSSCGNAPSKTAATPASPVPTAVLEPNIAPQPPAATDSFPASKDSGKESVSGYLSISVDDGERRFRRGDSDWFDFGGKRVLWNFFLALWRENGKVIQHADILNRWESFGGGGPPEKLGIPWYVNQLNKIIRPAGVSVVVVRTVGYKLISSEQISKTPPKKSTKQELSKSPSDRNSRR